MKPEFSVLTFSTTLTPLARVVSRNDASTSDGDNKMLVCVMGEINAMITLKTSGKE
jgi:hypothetical protein